MERFCLHDGPEHFPRLQLATPRLLQLTTLLTFIIYEGLHCLSARAVVKFSLVVATERNERLCGAAGGLRLYMK
jgi:hypothetical protein